MLRRRAASSTLMSNAAERPPESPSAPFLSKACGTGCGAGSRTPSAPAVE
jgi:hypothetical protein